MQTWHRPNIQHTSHKTSHLPRVVTSPGQRSSWKSGPQPGRKLSRPVPLRPLPAQKKRLIFFSESWKNDQHNLQRGYRKEPSNNPSNCVRVRAWFMPFGGIPTLTPHFDPCVHGPPFLRHLVGFHQCKRRGTHLWHPVHILCRKP